MDWDDETLGTVGTVRVNTATILIIDPGHLAHEHELIARLVEEGKATLVSTEADGTFHVVGVGEEDDAVVIESEMGEMWVCEAGAAREMLGLEPRT